MGRKLFEEILGLRESEFTKRINGLKKKDEKKYLLLNGYCQFWVLKLLLSEYCLNVETIFELDELLLKSLTWLNACDK